MRNKLTALFIFIIVVALSTGISILGVYSYKLQRLVDEQNITLENYSKIDSIYDSGQEDIMNSINKFFDNVPTYKDGEQVSAIDFVAYHERMMDSLRLYKDYYEYSQERYGVNLKKIFPTDSTYRIVSDPPTKADTASMLVPYYNDFVYKKGDTWYTVTTDYKSLYNEQVEKYNKTVKDHRDQLKDVISLLEELSKKIENYESILDDLENKGLIKRDTTDN